MFRVLQVFGLCFEPAFANHLFFVFRIVYHSLGEQTCDLSGPLALDINSQRLVTIEKKGFQTDGLSETHVAERVALCKVVDGPVVKAPCAAVYVDHRDRHKCKDEEHFE